MQQLYESSNGSAGVLFTAQTRSRPDDAFANVEAGRSQLTIQVVVTDVKVVDTRVGKAGCHVSAFFLLFEH